MSTNDFCETSGFYCIAESVLALAPTITYFVLGYMAYTQASRRTSYVREWATPRHLVKLVLSALLALTCLVMSIVYPLVETGLVSLKTEITWGISFLIWTTNTFLLRVEYKNLGYTSKNLKYAWYFLFFCQTIILIMGAANYDYDNFQKVALIYYLNDSVLFVLVIYVTLYSDDFPPQKSEGLYDSILDNVSGDESYEYTGAKRTRSSFTDHFRPMSFDDGNRVFSKKDRKKYEQRLKEANQEVSIKGSIESLQTITVNNHREITREGDKTTIVYLIEFTINGKSFSTERSYNEFRVLIDEIMRNNKGVEFPPLPPKGAKKDDEAAIKGRLEFLDTFLKICVEKRIGFIYLGDFLQPTDILEYFSKDFVKQSIGTKKSFSGKQVNPGTLKDGAQLYDIDCASAKPRGKDLAIHYAIRVKNLSAGGKETLVYKRYNDFKALHEFLKKAHDKKSLPELPYKGSAGLFAKEDAVVDYRKGALIEYLGTVLNTPGIQDTPYLLDFIKPANSEEA